MSKLRVRVYDVGFGDAILVSVPDKTETRFILIDFGNLWRPKLKGGTGWQDLLHEPVVKDILKVLAGRSLDLYVMTHKHLDHVEGLPYSDKKLFNGSLKNKLQWRYAWFTGSADPDYYLNHPEAETEKKKLEAAYKAIENFLQAAPERETPYIGALMANNDEDMTDRCVNYLRKLTTPTTNKPSYVYRDYDLKGTHPFQEASFKIWAPEEDTSTYYAKIQPMALGVTPGMGRGQPTLTHSTPPGGVDAGAFYNLVEMRRRGYLDNLSLIDKAKNNTSIVFLLEWGDWKLLFTGDAEDKSWKMMDEHNKLEDVHFLKVSHHGGESGMPPTELLEKILPGESQVSPDGKPRYAVVSTRKGNYANNPTPETLEELQERCHLYSTEEHVKEAGYLYVELAFERNGKQVTVHKGK